MTSDRPTPPLINQINNAFRLPNCGGICPCDESQVLNDMMTVVKAGGGVGIPGLYVTEDPGAADAAAKVSHALCPLLAAAAAMMRLWKRGVVHIG